MSNDLSLELLAQLFAQGSDDPFLSLITLSHASFAQPYRFVNNQENIISNGNTFLAFPVKIKFASDDGEGIKEVSLEFDNVGLDLITPLRTVTDQIDVKIEMILASIPNVIQTSLDELKLQTVSYDKQKISAKLYWDSFLNTELSCEKYEPTNFKGLF